MSPTIYWNLHAPKAPQHSRQISPTDLKCETYGRYGIPRIPLEYQQSIVKARISHNHPTMVSTPCSYPNKFEHKQTDTPWILQTAKDPKLKPPFLKSMILAATPGGGISNILNRSIARYNTGKCSSGSAYVQNISYLEGEVSMVNAYIIYQPWRDVDVPHYTSVMITGDQLRLNVNGHQMIRPHN